MTPTLFLTLAKPSAAPARPAAAPTLASLTLASPLKAQSEPAKALDADAAPTDTAKTDIAKTAASSLEDMQKQRRQSLKDQARAQVLALVERIRTLKQFASDNPEVMAKQLATIVKALKSALKAYAEAGGAPRGMGADTSVPAAPSQPAAPTDARSGSAGASEVGASTGDAAPTEVCDADPKPLATSPDLVPRSVYEEMRDSVSGSEAASDMDFVKLVRGVGKVIRDLLTKAKIQTALKGPDDETKKAFEATAQGLRDVDEALDKMDRDIRNSSPAAGMFVALYA